MLVGDIKSDKQMKFYAGIYSTVLFSEIYEKLRPGSTI